MPTIVETEVFTLDELAALGDESSTERALTWIADTYDWVASEDVSETLTEAMREAFGKDTLTWDAWDYMHTYVNVSGTLSRESTRIMDEGPFAGLAWPGGDLVESFTYRTRTARDYGGDVWVYVTEDGPSWMSDEYAVLCDEVTDWIKEVEGRLARLMVAEYEYLTSREYLMEMARSTDYTFTIDGRPFA